MATSEIKKLLEIKAHNLADINSPYETFEFSPINLDNPTEFNGLLNAIKHDISKLINISQPFWPWQFGSEKDEISLSLIGRIQEDYLKTLNSRFFPLNLCKPEYTLDNSTMLYVNNITRNQINHAYHFLEDINYTNLDSYIIKLNQISLHVNDSYNQQTYNNNLKPDNFRLKLEFTGQNIKLYKGTGKKAEKYVKFLIKH